MDGKWVKTKAGRSVIAVGGAALAAVIVVVALTNGDSDTATSAGSEVSSRPTDETISPTDDAVADETASETSPPTSDQGGVANSTSSSSETDDDITNATLASVPVGTVVVLDPIPLDDIGDFGTGLSVRLVDIEAIQGEARTQGEVAGPALRVHVEVTNDSDDPISLERTQVEITYGDARSPGIVLTGSGTTPFAESVAPGDSSTGIFVFAVPIDQRDAVQVAVTQTTGTPIVLFEGSAP